jgi:hypothetical protein
VGTVFLVALFWYYCVERITYRHSLFYTVISCCFITDKVKLLVAFDRRQATVPYIRAVMDSRQPARNSAPVPDSGVWGTTHLLTPTVHEHRNLVHWSIEMFASGLILLFCLFIGP